MEVESKYTTIRISKELRRKLVELKLNLNVRTYEDVIVYLLDSSSRSKRDLDLIINAMRDFCKRNLNAGFEFKCSEIDKSINELIKFVYVTEYVRQTTQK